MIRRRTATISSGFLAHYSTDIVFLSLIAQAVVGDGRVIGISAFTTAAGDVLAISIPRTETAVIRHFQERMPYGLFVPEVT